MAGHGVREQWSNVNPGGRGQRQRRQDVRVGQDHLRVWNQGVREPEFLFPLHGHNELRNRVEWMSIEAERDRWHAGAF
jgi:hypothetical protein